MSYQVLARKWRPAAFEEMVGQSHVLHALTNALGQQRLHHAYLFTGTRGVGKTSIARLFAKGLNCEQGVTAKPCGVCSSCVEIAQGRFVDLIEVDAASRTKVDDTRELLDNVQYRPTRGRFKVYLIDEVHMLSRSSFNALLKTLEEPPEHVKFLLATTDPQKLPVTVLSRCLQFNLKSLSQDEIAGQLSHVLSQEAIPAEAQALTLLAKAANGSMRDGLSLTDQAIAFGAGEINLTQVQTMLGSIDERHVLGLFEALVTTDIQQVLKKVAEVLAFGADAAEVLRSLLELLHQITLTQFAPAAAHMSLYEEQIKAFATQLNPEQVQLYYQILLSGRKELAYAPDPKSGLEMALMRVIAFSPVKGSNSWSADSSVSRFAEKDEQSVTARPIAEAPVNKAIAAAITTNSIGASSIDTIAAEHEVAAAANQKESSGEIEAEIDNEPSSVVDEKLVAEQAVILSQAQSQGYQADTHKSESDSSKIATGIVPSVEQSVKQAVEPQIDPLVKPNVEPALKQAVIKNVQAEVPSAETPAAPHSAQTLSSELSIAADDNVPLSMYLDSAEQGIEDEAYPLYPDETSISQDNQAVSAVNQTAATELLSAGDGIDDVLDAVLAARDSLLSDIERDAPKDGDAKKPEARTSIAPKRALPSDDSYQASPERVAVQNETSAEAMAEIETKSAAETRVESLASSNDRPPWEPQATAPIVDEEPLTNEIESQSADSIIAQGLDADNIVKDQNNLLEDSSVEPKQAFRPVTDAEPQVTSAQVERTQIESTQVKSAVANIQEKNTKQQPISQPNSANTHLPAVQVVGNDVDLHWYKLMAQLKVGGRVRQLAVNSLCLSLEMPIRLLLKPNQKHLSAPVAIEQLRAALMDVLAQECELDIQVGVDPQRETPLEIRKRFHQEILGQTQAALFEDDAIQWLQQNMAAELDTDSLSYPPELLAGRSGQIKSLAFIPSSNITLVSD